MRDIELTAEHWLNWRAAEYTILPYVARYPLPSDFRMATWERAWEEASPHAFVLESGKYGRFTYLGLTPTSSIRGSVTDEEQPLPAVKNWLHPFRAPRLHDLPCWLGGAIGYWGYDVIRSLERIPSVAKADLPCPDYYFVMVDKLWIIDQERDELLCAVHTHVTGDETESSIRAKFADAVREVGQMKTTWDRIVHVASDGVPATGHPTQHTAIARMAQLREDIAAGRIQIDVEAIDGVFTEFTRDDYIAAVRRIHEYIRDGDVFQVNLSVRQSRALRSPAEQVYEWLRHLNPSPYLAFLKFPEFQLVCGSPELLVRLVDGQLSTRPIAGTRPRGMNAAEDAKLHEELLASDKERAEHIMLVDLERNDLGRISRFGSVRVDELMTVEYYSHVMHIVSEVTGELQPGKDAFDVIAATFPGGTITGAPKIRTMEIIEELEPTRRGPYTGSIGWIDYNGNMEFNIIIRTLLAVDGIAHIQAGAGIVIDSIPEREYTESLNKAKALWKAVQYAENAVENEVRA